MLGRLSEKTNWRAVLLGWAVAIVAGVVLNLVFELAHVWLFGGEALDAAGLTNALVTLALISGFVAHFAGGYVAGRRAGADGGLHGLMVAGLGFLFVVVAVAIISAILVATAGVVLVEAGVPLPRITPALAGGTLLALLALLCLNLIGGFFGGKMGEWERGPMGALRGKRDTPVPTRRKDDAGAAKR